MADSTKRYQPPVRSDEVIEAMAIAGAANWRAHRVAAGLLRPGVRPVDLEAAISASLRHSGAEPLFQGVMGPSGSPYPAVSCISVNEGAVHGIPGTSPLQSGDVVSIDLGCRLSGWCADSAETHIVGKGQPRDIQLVNATRATLDLAIRATATSRSWSEVVQQVAAFLRGSGFRLIPTVFGHGIGEELHEAPQVALAFDIPMAEFQDFELIPGIVFTIEPVLTTGNGSLRVADDGWTLETVDGHPAAHCEHTIALTNAGPRILTRGI